MKSNLFPNTTAIFIVVAGLIGLVLGYFIALKSFEAKNQAAKNYDLQIASERASRPPITGVEIYNFSATVKEVKGDIVLIDSSPLTVSEIKLNPRTKITATTLKPVADFRQEILAYNSAVKNFGSDFIPGAPGAPVPPSASVIVEIKASELKPGDRIDVESREDVSGKTSVEAITIVVK